MPFLELKCKECGHVFEELTSVGKYPKCPVCGGETEQKYSGKLYSGAVKPSGCSGHCSSCKGCK